MTGKKKGSKQKERKTCDYKMHNGKSCGRKLYDDEHCIFHSKDIEGKKDKFNDAFRKEFERQKNEKEYDFTGFVFPGDFAFLPGEIFKKRTSFDKAKSNGKAEFCNVKFVKETSFSGAEFNRGALFRSTQFSREATFIETKFKEVVNFAKTQFSGNTDFSEAQFSGETLFNKAKFKEDTYFENIKIKKFNSFEMIDTYFYNVSGLFESIEKNNKKFKYSNKTEFLPDNFRLILGEEATARYLIISRKIRDDMYLLSFKKKHPKMHFIWWLFADCGRSIFRWALWSILFAVLFAVIYHNIYYLNDPTYFNQTHIYKERPSLSFLYYSVVTFTTLGFGDIVPKPGWLQFWVMLEVILGYIMLGGLISILANKLARRS
jgi:hypothetical protein